MIQAKGYAALKPSEPLVPYTFERRAPQDHDVVIDIKYCGICHTDIHLTKDEWKLGSPFPMVPGHEITGIVARVGAKVTKFAVGERVGVGTIVDSCRECTSCKQNLEQYCVPGNTMTYGMYERDGKTPTYGGYSNVIVTNEDFVLHIPDALPLDKAAPLLCAGITTYSPLRHWNAGPGKKVGVVGLGGLGHMAVKYAVALGADVTVISHSDKKRDDATRFGAQHFLNTSVDGALKADALTFDLIVNTVSSADQDMAALFGLLKLDGALVMVGAPDRPLEINVFPLIMARRSFAGSGIGSMKETQEMLDFSAKHNITAEIEVIEPAKVNQAYERVAKSDVRYRFVIDMSTL